MTLQHDIPTLHLRDQRLNTVGGELFCALRTQHTSNLKKLSGNCNQQIQFYRFLKNKHVHLDQLIYAVQQYTLRRLEQQNHDHLLLITDTTELNYEKQKHYHHGKNLGVVGNNTDLGYFLHAGVVLDAASHHLLGCLSLQLWTRTPDQVEPLPESRKWFVTAREARQLPAKQVTLVHDREGEIFQHWVQVEQLGLKLVSRAKLNRRVLGAAKGEKLFDLLGRQEEKGHFEMLVAADPKKHRSERRSRFSMRWCEVTIRCPEEHVTQKHPCGLTLMGLEVREDPQHVPEGEKPIIWRLLTNHRLNTLEDALRILGWYVARWGVEQCFSAIKTRVFDLESRHLSDGLALQKLGVMVMWAATLSTELVKRRDDGVTPASDFFTVQHIALLEKLNPTLEGRTQKLKNPHPKKSIGWAVWVIARLGSWHCYGIPGIKTMKRGLEAFELLFLGFSLQSPPDE